MRFISAIFDLNSKSTFLSKILANYVSEKCVITKTFSNFFLLIFILEKIN